MAELVKFGLGIFQCFLELVADTSGATSAIGRPLSTTIFAASVLNSAVYFLRLSGIYPPPFRNGPYWVRYPECGRRARFLLTSARTLGVGTVLMGCASLA